MKKTKLKEKTRIKENNIRNQENRNESDITAELMKAYNEMQ